MLAIEMRGKLEPIMVEGDFALITNAMNLAAISAKEYVIMENSSGRMVAIREKNILTIEDLTEPEPDDD